MSITPAIGPENGVPENAMRLWTGSLTMAAGEVAIREALTVVETESGLTAAIAKPFDLPIRRGGIRHTYGTRLIVLSVLRGGALTLESHTARWNGLSRGRQDRFDICRLHCTRRLAEGDHVADFPYDNTFRLTDSDVSSLLTPSDFLQNDMDSVGDPGAVAYDVFRPGNEDAMRKAGVVLERHRLFSPAAREAFGLEGMPGISAS